VEGEIGVLVGGRGEEDISAIEKIGRDEIGEENWVNEDTLIVRKRGEEGEPLRMERRS